MSNAIALPPPVEDEPAGTSADDRPTVVYKAQPRPVASPAPVAPQAPVMPAVPASPAEPWPQHLDSTANLRKRRLPKKARLAIFGGLAVVLLMAASASSRGSRRRSKTPALPLHDELVVNERDLKNRREVSAADFAPKQRYLRPAPAKTPALGAAEPAAEADSLASRRARRAVDPEDVLTQRATAAPQRQPPVALSKAGAPFRRRSLAIETSADVLPVDPPARLHVPAGATVAAVLASPIQLTSGSTTVVAVVSAGDVLPPGTRFIGTATLAGDRISARFRTAVLPTGEEVRINAEAQDNADGGFGLAARILDFQPSVGDEVASNAATDLVTDVLGRGVLGRAVDDYSRATQRQRRQATPGCRLALPSATPLMVFLHEGVVFSLM